jgi:hypothetical protein
VLQRVDAAMVRARLVSTGVVDDVACFPIVAAGW